LNDLSALIEKCKSGKQSAQADVYRIFAPKMFGVCMRYARDKTEAEDILHEAFVKVFTKIDQYSGRGVFEAWIRRIVVNVALEKYRTRYRLQTVDDITRYDGNTYVDYDVFDSMSYEQIIEIIAQLPPRYKMVFNMYAIDGYQHKEIAEMMGITEGTSKSNLARARKILQDKLKSIGYVKEKYAE
jgi:RNA polymerase sigma-70 factor (ECF subfamily)